MEKVTISVCVQCGNGSFDLFKKKGVGMVCCKCKYGEPMRPFYLYPKTLCSSTERKPDLEMLDKVQE